MSQIIEILNFGEGYVDTPYLDTLGFRTVAGGIRIGPKGTSLSNYAFRVPRRVDDVWSVLPEDVKAILPHNYLGLVGASMVAMGGDCTICSSEKPAQREGEGWRNTAMTPITTLLGGGWTIDTLNIEDCATPLNLNNARVVMRHINLQAGAKISNELTAGKWLLIFEYGYRRDENYGSLLTGSLCAGYYSGYKVVNNTDNDNWYWLMQLYFPVPNQQWVMELIGKADATTPSGTAGSPFNAAGTGRTLINLQRLATVWAGAYRMGQPSVLDMRYGRVGTTYAVVWLNLDPTEDAGMRNILFSRLNGDVSE